VLTGRTALRCVDGCNVAVGQSGASLEFQSRPGDRANASRARLQRDAALAGGLRSDLLCWLRIDGLWVDNALRHRSIGTRLITRAENHAIARGCHSAWQTTFQARGFYEAVGYEVFGTLDNFPAGQQQHFLRKRLIP
jgi:ribosomal protein S18 acetylase RimI-like enzyme